MIDVAIVNGVVAPLCLTCAVVTVLKNSVWLTYTVLEGLFNIQLLSMTSRASLAMVKFGHHKK